MLPATAQSSALFAKLEALLAKAAQMAGFDTREQQFQVKIERIKKRLVKFKALALKRKRTVSSFWIAVECRERERFVIE